MRPASVSVAVLWPTSPEPPPAVLRYADDTAVFFSLASPPAPLFFLFLFLQKQIKDIIIIGPVPFPVVVCVVDLFYIE
jgi:hypothetical protein